MTRNGLTPRPSGANGGGRRVPNEECPARAMRVVLRIESGVAAGREFSFAGPDRFLVGRAREAHLRLPENEPFVSRNHCLFEISPPNLYLRDLESLNGTYVNGTRTAATCLQHGDHVRIGNTVMTVLVDPSETDSCDPPRHDHAPTAATAPDASRGEELRAVRTVVCAECGRAASRGLEGDADVWDSLLYLCRDCAARAQQATGPLPMNGYHLLAELGRGGMGVVYKAWRESNGRLVALKKLLPQGLTDRQANELFQREMTVLRQLSHRHIVPLIDHGRTDQGMFFVSEYMDGGDLNRLMAEVRGAPLGMAEASRYTCEVLSALEWAHQCGFVHRDVKPSNILLRRTGKSMFTAKLSDFGLAKSFVEAGGSYMTRRGDAGGTLLFMAPEQFHDYRFVKPPADLYAVGITYYYLLTGRLPFHFPSPLDRALGRLAGREFKDAIRIVLEDSPIPVQDQDRRIPRELASVVDRSIRKAHQQRYQSAAEMRGAIERACGLGTYAREEPNPEGGGR